MKKLKLIWDFHGPDAHKTAEHQEKHLKEFIETEKADIHITGVEHLDDMYSICYIVVNEEQMLRIRDVLKPHRGAWYDE
ncbi:MAG: hypothetical protein WDA08_03175 [Weeksellaceae bacterium]|jgi:hypothetical protein